MFNLPESASYRLVPDGAGKYFVQSKATGLLSVRSHELARAERILRDAKRLDSWAAVESNRQAVR